MGAGSMRAFYPLDALNVGDPEKVPRSMVRGAGRQQSGDAPMGLIHPAGGFGDGPTQARRGNW